MRNRYKSRFVTLPSLILISLVIVFYLIQILNNWKLVGLSGIQGRLYGDSYQVISAAGCDLEGIEKLFLFNPERPECYYTYGSLLLRLLHILQITTDHLIPVAIFSISLTLILCFSQVAKLKNMKRSFYSLVVLASPGVWLLFERGNFDWLIFGLVVFSGYLCKRKNYFASAAVITISALFKFYTFPLLIIPFIFATKKTRFLIIMIALIALPICVMEASRADVGGLVYTLTATYGVNFMGLTLNAFGELLNVSYKLSAPLSLFLGLFISVLLLLTNRLRWLSYNNLAKSIGENTLTDPIFLLLSCTYLFSYAAGSSYDYRLIFLVGLILRIVAFTQSVKPTRFWAIIGFLAVWLTYFYAGFDNYLTDILRLTGNICQYLIFLALAKIVLKSLKLRLMEEKNVNSNNYSSTQ